MVALEWKMLVYFMAIWNIYGDLVHFPRFLAVCYAVPIKIWQPCSEPISGVNRMYNFWTLASVNPIISSHGLGVVHKT
jgi:hypothetical protein